MNVLRTLIENRFNDISISVDQVSVISPCKLELVIYNVHQKIKNKNIPFRCILNNGKSTMNLTNIQSIYFNVNEIDTIRYSKETIGTMPNQKICTIRLLYPLTVEQLAQLSKEFRSVVYDTKYFHF